MEYLTASLLDKSNGCWTTKFLLALTLEWGEGSKFLGYFDPLWLQIYHHERR